MLLDPPSPLFRSTKAATTRLAQVPKCVFKTLCPFSLCFIPLITSDADVRPTLTFNIPQQSRFQHPIFIIGISFVDKERKNSDFETSTGGAPPFNPDSFTTENTNEPYVDFFNFIMSQKDADIPQVISTSYGDDEQTVYLLLFG